MMVVQFDSNTVVHCLQSFSVQEESNNLQVNNSNIVLN